MILSRFSRRVVRAVFTLAFCASTGFAAAADASADRPNVIILLADDMGYGDIGVQGNTRISTPNIDAIATHGVRFTDGYVTAPVCSPSRAGLLTGRYQQRFGHEFNPGGRSTGNVAALERLSLRGDQVLLPQLMKDAGYATGMIGKWHLGQAPDRRPTARGFDEFFGFLAGQHTYYGSGYVGDDGDMPESTGIDRSVRDALHTRRNADPNPIYRGTAPVDEPEYLTDAFAREAVSFIERHRAEPFFLYVPFNAIHAPLEAPKRLLDSAGTQTDRRKWIYAAMTIALDEAVGRIMKSLDEAKLTDRTLIVFLSDNGGVFRPNQANYADNGPLRAGKLFVNEGGMRIPFMIQWPGHIEPGSVYRQPVSSMDILPTVLAAVGGKVPPDRPMDGVDLMPFLSGQKQGAPHEFLAWRLGRNRALREGDWKMLQYGDNPPKLFNLAQDIGESTDLAEKNPEKLKELLQRYARWESEMIPPNYRVREPIPLVFDGERINLDF